MLVKVSGTNSLHQMIYSSRAAGSAAAAQSELVDRILPVAITRNQRLSISGALLACDGWYLQALEGRRIDVNVVFARIAIDPRHSGVCSIWNGPIKRRSFLQWSMCASTLSPTDASIIEVLKARTNFDASKLDRQTAMKLLLAVGRLQGAEPPSCDLIKTG